MSNLKNTLLVNGKNGYECVVNKYWNGDFTITYEEFICYDPFTFNDKALGERALNCSSFEELRALIKKELAIDLLEEAHL